MSINPPGSGPVRTTENIENIPSSREETEDDKYFKNLRGVDELMKLMDPTTEAWVKGSLWAGGDTEVRIGLHLAAANNVDGLILPALEEGD